MITLTDQDGFAVREGTTDAMAVMALANDEYRLAGRNLSGWAFDVGAHIGTVALTMARQYHDLRVVAVEAVPENSELLEANIRRFGLTDRVFSIRAWAAGPNDLTGTCHYGYKGHRDTESDGYISAHRFIGNTWTDLAGPEFSVEMPAVSIDSLLETYNIPEVSLLKIDCEGCEWAFLDTPAVSRVQTIVGEYHGGYPGKPGHQPDPHQKLRDLLDRTHHVSIWQPEETVVGLFEATRRSVGHIGNDWPINPAKSSNAWAG